MALTLSPFAPQKGVLLRSKRRQSLTSEPQVSAIGLTPTGSPCLSVMTFMMSPQSHVRSGPQPEHSLTCPTGEARFPTAYPTQNLDAGH